MSVKRSITITKELDRKLKRLAYLMGITGVYGEIPRSIDFGVTLAIKYLENYAKVTPRLKPPEIRYLFNSVAVLHKEARAREMAEKGPKNA